jgi:hypothetical protein
MMLKRGFFTFEKPEKIKYFILVLVFLCSCMNTKKLNTVWIPKGQVLYLIHSSPPDASEIRDSIFFKKLTSGITAQVLLPSATTPDSRVVIKLSGDAESHMIDIDIPQIENDIPEQAFFPLSPKERREYATLTRKQTDGKFIVWQYQQAFQALTVPVQFRPRLNEFTPATASGNFNIGVGWVHKFTRVTYRKFELGGSKNFSSNVLNNFSISPGIFIAPSVISLTSANTNGNVKNNMSVLGSTAGILGVVGYNNLNMGLAVGFDKTYGALDKTWIYNGNLWIGLVFSIDFLK